MSIKKIVASVLVSTPGFAVADFGSVIYLGDQLKLGSGYRVELSTELSSDSRQHLLDSLAFYKLIELPAQHGISTVGKVDELPTDALDLVQLIRNLVGDQVDVRVVPVERMILSTQDEWHPG